MLSTRIAHVKALVLHPQDLGDGAAWKAIFLVQVFFLSDPFSTTRQSRFEPLSEFSAPFGFYLGFGSGGQCLPVWRASLLPPLTKVDCLSEREDKGKKGIPPETSDHLRHQATDHIKIHEV